VAWMSVCVHSVCWQRPCGGLIPRPRSPTDCVEIKKMKKRPGSTRAVEPQVDMRWDASTIWCWDSMLFWVSTFPLCWHYHLFHKSVHVAWQSHVAWFNAVFRHCADLSDRYKC
jgi:hypothetical protein